MYKKVNMNRPSNGLKSIETYEGETIEQKINRITNNKEPIKDGAPLVYTERKDGVKPEYNIKTDRFEVAIEGMDIANRSKTAQRNRKAETKIIDINKKDVKDEPIGATGENPSK